MPVQASPLTAFSWSVQPLAEELVIELIDRVLVECPEARLLSERMQMETGTRFRDWVDYLAFAPDASLVGRLAGAGFRRSAVDGTTCFRHEAGLFPAVVLEERAGALVAVKVDSVVDFAAAHHCDAPIEGAPGGPLRRLVVTPDRRAQLAVVERHGFRGFAVPETTAELREASVRHLEAFRTRRRSFRDDRDGFAHARKLIDAAIREIGRDWACDLFFQAEREYWQRRNRAARVQKARQDALGLGWANHDHHTYRSSRQGFAPLIALLETLGFQARERFYAGREAGWGAQIVEQPVTGITIFADVDLSADEIQGDFAHEALPPRRELGTVGLWCALHGEAFLQAGMHHLECQFEFESLREQLQEAGVGMMKPFTEFPYLRQAFTEGERWAVAEERIAQLERDGRISAEKAEKFRREGAIGSHLENLERNQGFKGFNQTGISEIIAGTDPRRH